MQPAAGTVVFRCPKCSKAHRALQSAVGKHITCSKCHTTIAVPSADAPANCKATVAEAAKTEPVTYWQPVTPAAPPVSEPTVEPENWLTAPEEEPVISRRPKRRSFAIWKIAILVGHAALIAAAVAVWFMLQKK
jgi:hypothetical protein